MECCRAARQPDRRDQEDILAAAQRHGEELENCSHKLGQTDFLFSALRRRAAARVFRLPRLSSLRPLRTRRGDLGTFLVSALDLCSLIVCNLSVTRNVPILALNVCTSSDSKLLRLYEKTSDP
jgi:hypothetical protein